MRRNSTIQECWETPRSRKAHLLGASLQSYPTCDAGERSAKHHSGLLHSPNHLSCQRAGFLKESLNEVRDTARSMCPALQLEVEKLASQGNPMHGGLTGKYPPRIHKCTHQLISGKSGKVRSLLWRMEMMGKLSLLWH